MARQAFYSFHYAPDSWRASQIRNMGIVEGNQPAKDNDWEQVKKGGDSAIEKWIADQMTGRSCTVVLIDKQTANRKWINHEIIKTWNDNKGLLGIYIHNLKDANGATSIMGANPFDYINVKGKPMQSIVHAYNPPYSDSKQVYDYIKSNLASWIETAIKIRTDYKSS